MSSDQDDALKIIIVDLVPENGGTIGNLQLKKLFVESDLLPTSPTNLK